MSDQGVGERLEGRIFILFFIRVFFSLSLELLLY